MSKPVQLQEPTVKDAPQPPKPAAAGGSMTNNILGSTINIISKSEIRYEGILVHVDLSNRTMTLQNVRSYGSEGRRGGIDEIPASQEGYGTIKFKVDDVKDLKIYSHPPPGFQDPAIVSATDPYTTGPKKDEPQKDQSKIESEQKNVVPSEEQKVEAQAPQRKVSAEKIEKKENQYTGGSRHQNEGYEKPYNRNYDKNYDYAADYDRQGGQTYQKRPQTQHQQYDYYNASAGNQRQRYPQGPQTGYIDRYGGGQGGNYRQSTGGYYNNSNRSQNYQGGYQQQPHGGGSGYGNKRHYHQPVGELTQNPNESLKEQFKEDFDFEQMLSKVEKLELGEDRKEEKNEKKESPKYDKAKSFFDMISSSTIEKKQEAHIDRDLQRKKDSETFGLPLNTTNNRGGMGNRRFMQGGRGGGYRRGGAYRGGRGRPNTGSQEEWGNQGSQQQYYHPKVNKNE